MTFDPESGRRRMVLPGASHRSFWWKGGSWECPTYENAEGLVTRWAREDLIGRETLIDDALRGGAGGVSLRTLQRRFYLATGQLVEQYGRSNRPGKLPSGCAKVQPRRT